MQEILETPVRSLDWEDPLEEGMATPPAFLPGESHEQRSLAGYSPWGHKSRTWLSEHTHTRGLPLICVPILPSEAKASAWLAKWWCRLWLSCKDCRMRTWQQLDRHDLSRAIKVSASREKSWGEHRPLIRRDEVALCLPGLKPITPD